MLAIKITDSGLWFSAFMTLPVADGGSAEFAVCHGGNFPATWPDDKAAALLLRVLEYFPSNASILAPPWETAS